MSDYRVSDFFRAQSGLADRFDLDVERRRQEQLFQSLRPAPSRAASSQPSKQQQQPQLKRLAWTDLTSGVPQKTEAQRSDANRAKQDYFRLIKLITSITEDNGDAAEHAAVIYSTVASQESTGGSRAAAGTAMLDRLRSLYPGQKPTVYADLLSMSEALKDWRKRAGASVVLKPPAGRGGPSASSSSTTSTTSTTSSTSSAPSKPVKVEAPLVFSPGFMSELELSWPEPTKSSTSASSGSGRPSSSSSSSSSSAAGSGSSGPSSHAQPEPSGPGSFDAGPMNETWLLRSCELYCAGGGEAGSYMTPAELAANIFNLLKQDLKQESISESLMGLLGFEAIEFVLLLLDKRLPILELVFGGQVSSRAQGPRHGPSISITTHEQKLLAKLRKKDRGRSTRANQQQQQQQHNQQQQQQGQHRSNAEIIASMTTPLFNPAAQTGPDRPLQPLIAADTVLKGIDEVSGLAQKLMLPENAVRRRVPGQYEEVRVPPVVHDKPFDASSLVPLTAFNELSQRVFRGASYASLNRIQSAVFSVAYGSNANMLVCAPTGAGKTNVALMTVLHEIEQHASSVGEGGYVDLEAFKIIYVAPLKALAAEMVANFQEKLSCLRVRVRELTGDMQMTRQEIRETQMIVTTPEKWDVITRKTSDDGLVALVRLLIIDEVHLINEDRGPVIETLVARTLRLVESSQSMIRMVGLSATLPNYRSVARFLHVGETGLFYFGPEYRPCPLQQNFIGIQYTDIAAKNNRLNDLAFERALAAVQAGKQAMVFVHSRNDTYKSAERFSTMAAEQGCASLFAPDMQSTRVQARLRDLTRTRSRQLTTLTPLGFGCHHGGMLRSDRNLTERFFMEGIVRVLVCTATLAWGVNLPAHTVIIKGTQLYDSRKSAFVELNMLDVTQIFGRAGRPQFDTSGDATIITDLAQLPRYLGLLTSSLPIESQFVAHLADNLNAEIVLGSVNNVQEAMAWLSYTYLYIRMRENPLAYGIATQELLQDADLVDRRRQLVLAAAESLDRAQMVRFSRRTGQFGITDLGRVASHFYISMETIELFNASLTPTMTETKLVGMVGRAHEFEQMRVREEEQPELYRIEDEFQLEVAGGPTHTFGKVGILLHAYLLNVQLDSFSLVSDQAYVVENAKRIFRALFEIVLNKGWSSLAQLLLLWVRMLDRRMSVVQHPLLQFEAFKRETVYKLETHDLSLDRLVDMPAAEISATARMGPHEGKAVVQCVRRFPWLELEVASRPITRTILQVNLTVTPSFRWFDAAHGSALGWWVWVEDTENDEYIYHSEYFTLRREQASEAHHLVFTIPLREPMPSQYVVQAVSDSWLGADTSVPISFKHLILPEQHPPHTELLDLTPLPRSALGNAAFEQLYSFGHFNAVQTQFFHTLYHTDTNVLLGAPTGSGKTVAAELAVLQMLRDAPPGAKAVYIAPLKALVNERMKDWKRKFVQKLGKTMVELTGDVTPDILALKRADIVTTTPEKWDGVTRNWYERDYVKDVALVIIDEIHLLGGDRGPILEIIVSRMRYISSQTSRSVRIVGLSTALANARDLSEWLGVSRHGLFNFQPKYRPVPIEPHIAGFSGKHYCPRMQTMNKPAYNAIRTHSPEKPVLVFVSSRRQTRLTAADLISYAATDPMAHPRQFIHCDEGYLAAVGRDVRDPSLKHTLAFGIGLHHAGLSRADKKLVERLFGDGHIQVLISTSTLAWGVNLPAHLVVIKGTEFFDAKTHRYVDMPITDIMQMMGRAGRPQFDRSAVACVFVQQEKRNFYKKFLFEPFPVESSLGDVLHDHFNAEVAGGTITCTQDAIDYLTWTFWFRRLLVNPSYYSLESTAPAAINAYLTDIVNDTFAELERARCIQVFPEGFVDQQSGHTYPPGSVQSLTLGQIASYYYLKHKTMSLFHRKINAACTLETVLAILTSTAEYDELPVRHNEELLNEELNKTVPFPHRSTANFESPHVKAHLLLQCHFSRLPLPITDYGTDLRSVLDQSIRILQAVIDVAAENGWLDASFNAMHIAQMLYQARWLGESSLANLPHIDAAAIDRLRANGIAHLCQLVHMSADRQRHTLQRFAGLSSDAQLADVAKVLDGYPVIRMTPQVVKAALGGEITMRVKLERLNDSSPDKVFAPGFTKNAREQWWLVVGTPAGELLALKRVQLQRVSTPELVFLCSHDPEATTNRAKLVVYLISGNYIGLDQEKQVEFVPDLFGASTPPPTAQPEEQPPKPIEDFWG